jgi:hypothetical protein
MGNQGSSKHPRKLCFVIGPMRTDDDIARQQRLATEILHPLLVDHGFDVITPDRPQAGQIMRQVMAFLDRADLVVADLTGSNPSVMYELAIRHCIGLPTLMVRHAKAGDLNPPELSVAFDLRHYRHQELDLDDPVAARKALQATLETTLGLGEQSYALKAVADNPVTEFYKDWPLIEASPAAGLALGYYINLVKRTAKALCDPDSKVFLLNDKKVQIGELERQRIERLDLYIPRDLRQATVSHADSFRGRIKAQDCEIIAPGRRVGTFFVERTRSLLDVPTTLGALEEAVKRRVPGDPGINSDIARFVLSREITRFVDVVKRLIDNETHEAYDVIQFLTRRVHFHDLPPI